MFDKLSEYQYLMIVTSWITSYIVTSLLKEIAVKAETKGARVSYFMLTLNIRFTCTKRLSELQVSWSKSV